LLSHYTTHSLELLLI